jgi:hypothetical protein
MRSSLLFLFAFAVSCAAGSALAARATASASATIVAPGLPAALPSGTTTSLSVSVETVRDDAGTHVVVAFN